ncbi:hypothetical protein D3C77_663930 [compost metagenome]
MRRQLARSDMTVTQHQLGLAAAHRFFRLIGDVAHRSFQANTFLVVEVDQLTLETWAIKVHQRSPLGGRNHRRAENHP